MKRLFLKAINLSNSEEVVEFITGEALDKEEETVLWIELSKKAI